MIPIKNASEIDKMRQACRSASDILHKVSDLIRPGISTKEVDQAAADFMSDAGVKSAFLGYRLGHRVFPGNICISLNHICAEIEDEARRYGFSVVREFVGHGVGRKMHEEPQIPNYGKRGSGAKLKAGMTLAIEPMINVGTSDVRLLDDGWTVCTADGLPSAHFEHTVLITRDDPEILTWRAKTQLR